MACIYKPRSIQRMEGQKRMKQKFGIKLKPGDKIKVTTVLGTECILLYLGSKTYIEYGRKRVSHFTYLVRNSKGVMLHRTNEWKETDYRPCDLYRTCELVKQNSAQYEASKRMAKKRLRRYIENG